MSKHGIPAVGHVLEVEMMGPHLKRVQVICEKLVGFDYHPGQRLAIKVDTGVHRDYSLSSFDPISGRADFYAYLHGRGPGSQMIRSLDVGDTIEFLGPLKGTQFRNGIQSMFLAGDETAIAVALSFLNHPKLDSMPTRILGVLEVSQDLVANVSCLIPQIDIVKRDEEQPGKALSSWLRAQKIFPLGTLAVLLGRDLSVQILRDVLLNEFGFAPSEIQTCIHWYEGRALR